MESSENTAFTRSHFWQQVIRSPERLGLAALLGFVVLVVALYGGAFQHGWAFDDSQILKHAVKYSPWEYFFIPAAWKALVPFYLTPWLSLAYDVDLSLFGLNPWGFYGHNLLVLAGCGVALFLLLRRWLTDDLAMMTSVLMLVGTPMATASQQLMVRHYTEGLFFFLVGLLCFLRSLKARHAVGRWMVAGALCFCIAVFSKELFVPLGLLPLVMPADNLSIRWKRWWPWALVFVLYWPWRTYMLGTAIGGAAIPIRQLLTDGWALAVPSLLRIPSFLLPSWAGWFALAVLLAGCVVAGVGRKWGVLVWAVISVLLSVAPLMPLALIGSLAEDRFFVVVWVVMVVNLGVCLATLVRMGLPPWLAYVAMALLALAAWSQSSEVLKKLDQTMAVYQAHGDAVSHGTAKDIVSVSDRLLPHFLPGMLDLRSLVGLATDAPAVVSDEVELAAMALEGRRLLRYNNATNAMFDASEQSRPLLADWRKRLSDTPFQARITYNGQAKTLDWAIDAPGATKYFHIAGGARTEIPPKFAIRVEKRPEPCFWICIEGPGPMIRYSGLVGLPTTPDLSSVEVVWKQPASLLPEKVQCERPQ